MQNIESTSEQMNPALMQEVANYNAYVENMRLMNNIVAEMKEIPFLPSEKPKEGDTHPLIKVEFLEAGGVLTYMEGYKYPYKGFPFFEFVDKIDMIKKISRQTQSAFYHALKNRSKFVLLLLIPTIPIWRNVIWAFTYVFFRLIERFKVKTIRYCPFVREVHRAFSVEPDNESKQIRQMREMMRDIECMILEFDNAYRYRAQDILPEFNKENLLASPIKEFHRVLDIMISREKTDEVKDTWRLLKMFVSYYMRFDRKFRDIFVKVIVNLDMEKIMLDEGDKMFCEKRADYNFKFFNSN